MNLKVVGIGIMIVGIGICVLGTGLAILFVPCKFMGQFVGWHFIFEPIEVLGRKAGMMYQLLDPATLLLELILINGVGVTLAVVGFFVNRKQKGAKPKRKSKIKRDIEIEELE